MVVRRSIIVPITVCARVNHADADADDDLCQTGAAICKTALQQKHLSITTGLF